jgi:sigma-B regulation protein RsbU (phosphoserine phosphatase)
VVDVEDATGRVVASVGPAPGTDAGPSGDRTAGMRRIEIPVGGGGTPFGRVVVRNAPAGVAGSAIQAAAGVLAAALSLPATDQRDVQRARIETELALGRRLQRSFVPLAAPDVPGWEVASRYEPAREVGGDFFDAFRPRGRSGELALVIADVTGKGIAAALLMAFARPLLHAAIDHARRPAVALERTNRILVDERRTALFITAQVIALDVGSGRFRLANAGHEPPLISRAAGGLEEVDARGVLVGAFSTLALEERAGDLAPGDLLLLYTDGVTDARAPTGERFGDERLRAIVAAAKATSAQDLVDEIARASAAFGAGEPAADDITLLAVRRLPGG